MTPGSIRPVLRNFCGKCAIADASGLPRLRVCSRLRLDASSSQALSSLNPRLLKAPLLRKRSRPGVSERTCHLTPVFVSRELKRALPRAARTPPSDVRAGVTFCTVCVGSEPPFHLTRRGWGEFPVRIQIHFKDPRNKRIDIIHQLKVRQTVADGNDGHNCVITALLSRYYSVITLLLHCNNPFVCFCPRPTAGPNVHWAADTGSRNCKF